jgi:hypothetical protein
MGFDLVGAAGFEPTTSTSQMWRDTGLRYAPNYDTAKLETHDVTVFRGVQM